MRKTFRVLAYLLVAEVVIQAMAIAYALSGLTYWVGEDGGVLNEQVLDSRSAEFEGAAGFGIHAINGLMIVPLLALLLLVFSFFAKVPQGTRRAAIVLGLVVLQAVLGITSHSVPFVSTLHALNAFAILVVALQATRSAGGDPLPAPTEQRVGSAA